MPVVDPLLQALARVLLGFALARAAWHKARDLPAFRRALADYALLPERSVALAAPALCASELALAGGLAWPGGASAASGGAAGLLLLYSGAIAINLARGRAAIDCGCSGPAAARPLGPDLLLRNAALIALALAAAAPVGDRPLAAPDLAALAAASGVAVLLYLGIEQALANAPRLRALRSAS